MPAAWNRAPSNYADKLGPVVDKQQAFKSLVTYVLVGVIAAVSSRHGYVALLLNGVAHA